MQFKKYQITEKSKKVDTQLSFLPLSWSFEKGQGCIHTDAELHHLERFTLTASVPCPLKGN